MGRASTAHLDCAACGTGAPTAKAHGSLLRSSLFSCGPTRKDVVPQAPATRVGQDKPKSRPKYIRWSDLLCRVLWIEPLCQTFKLQLRLISLIKSEAIAKKILTAMHLPADIPELHPARPPPGADDDARAHENYIN